MDLVWSALVGAVAAIVTSACERAIGRLFDGAADKEAQLDRQIAAVEALALEIRDQATTYWCGRGANLRLSGSIVGRLQFTGALVDEIFASEPTLMVDCSNYLNDFDLACTDGTFEVKDRKPEPGRCRKIEIAAYAFVHRCKVLRRKL